MLCREQIHFIKKFSCLYLEVKGMTEFIIPPNKPFCLFLVNCTKYGLITVSRIASHICGPKSYYCHEPVGQRNSALLWLL